MYPSIKDAQLVVTTALPAAAANVTCTAIDLHYPSTHVPNVELIITVPATPALNEGYAITFTVENGATSTPATSTGQTFTVTGRANAAGGAASEFRWRPASDILRYIAVNAAVASGGGTNTAVSFTVALVPCSPH